MYSISFIGIILIIISLSLSNTRSMFTKRKRRYSIDNNSKNSYITISMNPFPNVTTIPLEDDDEDLIQCDISSNFCETDSIELRLEQELDADDENDN